MEKSMIKIIDQPKSFICTCIRCGCKFEYDHTDLLLYRKGEYVIRCPICEEENHHDVGVNKIPDLETITYSYTPSNIPGLPTSITAPDGCDLKITYETFCDNIEGY